MAARTLEAALALVAASTPDRRLGWLVVLAGGLLALAVQIAAPVGVPLYDGVVVQEPYRFLHPGSGQPGSPTSFSTTVSVTGAISPIFVAATSENPPQAQLIVQTNAFVVTSGTTALQVAVTPIEAPPPPPDGTIAGNVYRFSVTDQAGSSLPMKPCDGCRSLLLRAPDGVIDAKLARYENGAWVSVETVHAGVTGLYQTNPTALGDYAVIAGIVPSADAGPSPILLVGGAVLVVLLAAGAFLLLKVRQAPPEPSSARGRPAGAPPTRIPSKRKGPRKPPPSGRSK